jgi:hypothetical protein
MSLNFKVVTFTGIAIILIAYVLFSADIYTPNYCSGSIDCTPKGSCEMMDTGACDVSQCSETHCPISTKRCIYKPNYNAKCKEYTSALNLCEDYCESHFLISCNCTSRTGSGGCFGVKDCDNY